MAQVPDGMYNLRRPPVSQLPEWLSMQNDSVLPQQQPPVRTPPPAVLPSSPQPMPPGLSQPAPEMVSGGNLLPMPPGPPQAGGGSSAIAGMDPGLTMPPPVSISGGGLQAPPQAPPPIVDAVSLSGAMPQPVDKPVPPQAVTGNPVHQPPPPRSRPQGVQGVTMPRGQAASYGANDPRTAASNQAWRDRVAQMRRDAAQAPIRPPAQLQEKPMGAPDPIRVAPPNSMPPTPGYPGFQDRAIDRFGPPGGGMPGPSGGFGFGVPQPAGAPDQGQNFGVTGGPFGGPLPAGAPDQPMTEPIRAPVRAPISPERRAQKMKKRAGRAMRANPQQWHDKLSGMKNRTPQQDARMANLKRKIGTAGEGAAKPPVRAEASPLVNSAVAGKGLKRKPLGQMPPTR